MRMRLVSSDRVSACRPAYMVAGAPNWAARKSLTRHRAVDPHRDPEILQHALFDWEREAFAQRSADRPEV
jgi:hypothetical protein